jgi:transposase
VSIDMWDPYIASIKKHVDNAGDKIVFDKFHVAAHLGKAVDAVRRLVKTEWSLASQRGIAYRRAVAGVARRRLENGAGVGA